MTNGHAFIHITVRTAESSYQMTVNKEQLSVHTIKEEHYLLSNPSSTYQAASRLLDK